MKSEKITCKPRNETTREGERVALVVEAVLIAGASLLTLGGSAQVGAVVLLLWKKTVPENRSTAAKRIVAVSGCSCKMKLLLLVN